MKVMMLQLKDPKDHKLVMEEEDKIKVLHWVE
jgi:hypothetical protein